MPHQLPPNCCRQSRCHHQASGPGKAVRALPASAGACCRAASSSITGARVSASTCGDRWVATGRGAVNRHALQQPMFPAFLAAFLAADPTISPHSQAPTHLPRAQRRRADQQQNGEAARWHPNQRHAGGINGPSRQGQSRQQGCVQELELLPLLCKVLQRGVAGTEVWDTRITLQLVRERVGREGEVGGGTARQWEDGRRGREGEHQCSTACKPAGCASRQSHCPTDRSAPMAPSTNGKNSCSRTGKNSCSRTAAGQQPTSSSLQHQQHARALTACRYCDIWRGVASATVMPSTRNTSSAKPRAVSKGLPSFSQLNGRAGMRGRRGV